MTVLQQALTKFISLYHADSVLLSEQAGWHCSIALYASDTDETLGLKITNGWLTVIEEPLSEVDLLIQSTASVLQDVLELSRDPNEPYLFGELTVQGPETHFLRLDYVMTMMCENDQGIL